MWQMSIGSVMGAASGRDFVMHSRIGVLRLFNSGHKDTLEKAREIKTVQGISESWDEVLRFRSRENTNPSKAYSHAERVSEIDLMSAIYPLSVHRRIERQWAERINSLRQIHGQIVVGTERTLQRVFNNDGSLIRVPIRAVVDRRQLDQSRPHD
jgi:hypothetical protein